MSDRLIIGLSNYGKNTSTHVTILVGMFLKSFLLLANYVGKKNSKDIMLLYKTGPKKFIF